MVIPQRAELSCIDDVRTRIVLSRVRSPPDPPGPQCVNEAFGAGGGAGAGLSGCFAVAIAY